MKRKRKQLLGLALAFIVLTAHLQTMALAVSGGHIGLTASESKSIESGSALTKEQIQDLNARLGTTLETNTAPSPWPTLGEIKNLSGLDPASTADLSRYTNDAMMEKLMIKLGRWSHIQSTIRQPIPSISAGDIWTELHVAANGANNYVVKKEPTWHLDGKIYVKDLVDLSVEKTAASIVRGGETVYPNDTDTSVVLMKMIQLLNRQEIHCIRRGQQRLRLYRVHRRIHGARKRPGQGAGQCCQYWQGCPAW